MTTIAFLDTEVTSQHHIVDLGCILSDGRKYHGKSVIECLNLIEGTDFLCGHNIIHHDIKYLKLALPRFGIESEHVIDTLYLSPLLFPNYPSHKLLKDDKLSEEDLNNPLNDAIKTQELFIKELAEFRKLPDSIKHIYFQLLSKQLEFQGFFKYLRINYPVVPLETLIRETFGEQICSHAPLQEFIDRTPVELAYSLALSRTTDRWSITPPWVLKQFQKVERIVHLLRNKPCLEGCIYCNQQLDAHRGLKEFFGFDDYRKYNGENLQEQAVKAAVSNRSLLAVFPTGGGKSITFQVPAFMSGRNEKGLTVVISPLQSLMKDQVDNLEKNGKEWAVTLNGLQDPVERSNAFERVENGSAALLYIAPESLRSKTLFNLLRSRRISRFVIDEAHCFSSWGQDFRVDYLYIADFIKLLQDEKKLSEPIPVSCFTATAKLKVIEDIQQYFSEKLGLKLDLFVAPVKRENLSYHVFERNSEEEKYMALRDLLESKECPTIVYVSRTKKAVKLAEQLVKIGFNARAFHGKMEAAEKTANQNAFINDEVQIMVATSAFGMGVDKSNVGLVIHYDISDSLENYIQEAGRAGRDQSMQADCHILFNEEDLAKHFLLLNQTKLHLKEIQQVWKAVKQLTGNREQITYSALEIARKSGWDEDSGELETQVIKAIAALEDSGYLKRGQNVPKVYANSILSKNIEEARNTLNEASRYNEEEIETAIRILRSLFSGRSRKRNTGEEAETRIDYLSDRLGIKKEQVIASITILRNEKILDNALDLTAFIKRGENKNKSLTIFHKYAKVEKFLSEKLTESEQVFHLKNWNEELESNGITDVGVNHIKTILYFWSIKNWVRKKQSYNSVHHFSIQLLQPEETFVSLIQNRHELVQFIVEYLYEKSLSDHSEKEELLMEFSVLELKDAYESSSDLFKIAVTPKDIEDALLFLSKIEAIKIEGGFLVVYNRLTIERIEKGNVQYKTGDYKKLHQFYENKTEQIHIVGEYASKMTRDNESAVRFVSDYFEMNYGSFVNRHFLGSRKDEIKLNITPAKYRKLVGELSVAQRQILDDKESQYISVIAGPGSGKTKLLVHKLASLLLLEDVKHEQLLMLTFSRAAVTEFKHRLSELIGGATRYIDIKTFHSYCFDLLGKVGTLSKSDDILKTTVEKIKNEEIESSLLTKTVLVIDEAQDMSKHEYELVQNLMERNEGMRVIMVGDDDQAIYDFRNSSSKYLKEFSESYTTVRYELLTNYRSKQNLIDFSNQFASKLNGRLKSGIILSNKTDNGKIRITKYTSNHLIEPFIQELKQTDRIGSAAVLTHTNDEAFEVYLALQKNGIPVRLIQGNDSFRLSEMEEVRFFLQLLELEDETFIIENEHWTDAKRQLKYGFEQSSKFDLVMEMIRVFEEMYPKTKYKADLTTFINDSVLENFYRTEQDIITVSTMHKVKGREFDQVFLLLQTGFQQHFEKEENKRLLYVALTRARNSLYIYVNGTYFEGIQTKEMQVLEDNQLYKTSDERFLALFHKDLWLDRFLDKETVMKQYKSGDSITVKNQQLLDQSGQPLLYFSQKMTDHIAVLNQKGYFLTSAKVNFKVHWRKKDTNLETIIILPELSFRLMN